MGGVAIQQAFIFCFCGFVYKFRRSLSAQQKTAAAEDEKTRRQISDQDSDRSLYAVIINYSHSHLRK